MYCNRGACTAGKFLELLLSIRFLSGKAFNQDILDCCLHSTDSRGTVDRIEALRMTERVRKLAEPTQRSSFSSSIIT